MSLNGCIGDGCPVVDCPDCQEGERLAEIEAAREDAYGTVNKAGSKSPASVEVYCAADGDGTLFTVAVEDDSDDWSKLPLRLAADLERLAEELKARHRQSKRIPQGKPAIFKAG